VAEDEPKDLSFPFALGRILVEITLRKESSSSKQRDQLKPFKRAFNCSVCSLQNPFKRVVDAPVCA